VIPSVTNVLRLKRSRRFEKTNSARLPLPLPKCDLRHVFPSLVLLLPPRLPAAPEIFNFPLCRPYLLTLQAAAVSRIAGKGSVHDAAKSGDVALLKDHLTADPNCIDARDVGYDRTAPLNFSVHMSLILDAFHF
jgi:hypothetical protein